MDSIPQSDAVPDFACPAQNALTRVAELRGPIVGRGTNADVTIGLEESRGVARGQREDPSTVEPRRLEVAAAGKQ